MKYYNNLSKLFDGMSMEHPLRQSFEAGQKSIGCCGLWSTVVAFIQCILLYRSCLSRCGRLSFVSLNIYKVFILCILFIRHQSVHKLTPPPSDIHYNTVIAYYIIHALYMLHTYIYLVHSVRVNHVRHTYWCHVDRSQAACKMVTSILYCQR